MATNMNFAENDQIFGQIIKYWMIFSQILVTNRNFLYVAMSYICPSMCPCTWHVVHLAEHVSMHLVCNASAKAHAYTDACTAASHMQLTTHIHRQLHGKTIAQTHVHMCSGGVSLGHSPSDPTKFLVLMEENGNISDVQ